MPFKPIDVEKEYEKDKNLKKEDVQILKEWMQKQPHLPKATDFQLITFLQSCYYRVEAAKTTMDNFFTVRTLCPDLFGCPSAEQIKQELSVGSINVLPETTPDGLTVILMKLVDPDPDHYRCVPQINLMDLIVMLDLHQNGTRSGLLAVMDMKGLSFGHLTKFHLVAIKKHLYYVQEAAPVRIKGLHYINVVPFADKLIAMVKPFMKRELIEMLHFHTESMESLYKVVPRSILPEDYGGEAPSVAVLQERNGENLLNNMDFFKWQDTQKVDERKRAGKPKSVSDVFGVDGTFKKLEFD